MRPGRGVPAIEIQRAPEGQANVERVGRCRHSPLKDGERPGQVTRLEKLLRRRDIRGRIPLRSGRLGGQQDGRGDQERGNLVHVLIVLSGNAGRGTECTAVALHGAGPSRTGSERDR